ncbi:hypothetical protein [Bacillus sp. T33-2]|uniref:hypothetical protein n=1 Tax=Bacillus sp. T33-2 TaxID=2054168 RepID=UPI001C608A2F|nr:hypothetical protein [Bacillus sp. T33-2]
MLEKLNLEIIKNRKLDRELQGTYAPRISEFNCLLQIVEDQKQQIIKLEQQIFQLKR